LIGFKEGRRDSPNPHPEVGFENVGFLMWLCAETALLIFSLKYSHPIEVIVTKFKRRSQSAGNFVKSYEGCTDNDENASETLSDKSIIKRISVHVPTQFKPISDTDFGHYLAGLIEGDGHFSKEPQIVIVFNEFDASLAYYIKGKIGYGNIYKVKNN
jgi:hypothetical protein